MDKTFNCIIYTTSNIKEVEKELPGIKTELMKARGIKDIIFSVVPIYKDILTYYIRSNSATGTNWDWFKQHITKSKVDMECIHITSDELRQMGLVHPNGYTLGGEYDVDKDDTMDCLSGVSLGLRSNYPNLTEFQRVVIHEFCHGFSHWTTGNAMGVVHDYDDPSRNINNILQLPYLYDFRKHTILTKIRDIYRLIVSMNSKAVQDNLYAVSLKALNTDVTPTDQIPDDVACASCVTTLLSKVMDFPHIPGTYNLLKRFQTDKRFQEVDIKDIQKGDIVLCATGTTGYTSPQVSNGHTGIYMGNNLIANNRSRDGLWVESYTIDEWTKRWFEYKVYVFRPISR